MDESDPAYAAARAEAERRFELATETVAQMIGRSIIAGEAPQAIVQKLEDSRNEIVRDAAIQSTRADLNPVVWVIDEAVKNLRTMLTE